jgi:hypothetical protein
VGDKAWCSFGAWVVPAAASEFVAVEDAHRAKVMVMYWCFIRLVVYGVGTVECSLACKMRAM